MTASEVPLATAGGMPHTTTIAGTMMIPPPTPSRPARIPLIKPRDQQSDDGGSSRPARPPRRVVDQQAHRRRDQQHGERKRQGVAGATAAAMWVPTTAPPTAATPAAPHRPVDLVLEGVRASVDDTAIGSTAASDVPWASRWSMARAGAPARAR